MKPEKHFVAERKETKSESPRAKLLIKVHFAIGLSERFAVLVTPWPLWIYRSV